MAKERELKWVKEAQEEMEAEEVKENVNNGDNVNPEVNMNHPEETVTEAAEGEVSGKENQEPETEEASEPEAVEGEVVEEPEAGVDGKLSEAMERYQRLFAEFDNFRKRTDKEKAVRYDMGVRDTIEKILPVLDSFELALKNVPEGEEKSPFAEGMDKIHKQFLKVLEDMGVTPIEAVGKEFNPDFHNAVMHVEDAEAGENIIVEEFQKGYLYKDHVVRYSMVKVAN